MDRPFLAAVKQYYITINITQFKTHYNGWVMSRLIIFNTIHTMYAFFSTTWRIITYKTNPARWKITWFIRSQLYRQQGNVLMGFASRVNVDCDTINENKIWKDRLYPMKYAHYCAAMCFWFDTCFYSCIYEGTSLAMEDDLSTNEPTLKNVGE